MLAVLLSVAFVNGLFAQDFAEPETGFEAVFSSSGVAAGDEITLAAVFKIAPDHHITDEKNGLFYVDLALPAGITVKDTVYPDAKLKNGEKVYHGDVAIKMTLVVAGTVAPGDYEIPISYSFQVCRDIIPETCFMPNGGDSKITLTVLEKGASAIPNTHPAFSGGEVEAAPATDPSGGGLEDKLTRALESGSFMSFLIVFLAGVLVSLTPCVYPMIPVIIGFVGAGAGGSKAKGFLLSVFFVIGLIITYSIFGVIAGATGALFGGFMSNPIVLVVIIAIFIALGASMLGAFDIALPSSVQGKLMAGQKQGFFGALFMGGVTGLVAAPCAGPPLLVLLGWIGNTGNLLLGFALMATFAFGIGILFIVIGTFAGAMTALPQAGSWMSTIKKGLGVVIFGVAVYYIGLLVSDSIFTLVLGGFLLFVGLFMGALAKWDGLTTGGKYGKGFGMLLFIAGVFYFVMGLAQMNNISLSGGGAGGAHSESAVKESGHVPWRVNDYDAVLADAAAGNKPILIDFYADWCGVCVELDHKVWNQQIVIDAAKSYEVLKLDYTRSNKELDALRKKYNIGGLPTVVILGPDGTERSRFSSFKEPEEVADWLNSNK